MSKQGNPKQNNPSVQELLSGLLNGDVRSLSRAITLVESTAERDSLLADELLDNLATRPDTSHRIAVTGVPGVGKSTFIERLGLHYISLGKKVAVLAVDPSSRISQGSILGDKTRMEKLSAHPAAYIRPSAAADTLGGVASRTRESMLLCEAAGYDIILIETVGVGQSETEVKGIVDTFLLLMLASAGDELQGIKRGIMEMADILVINKAEKENLTQAQQAADEYKNAMHLLGQDQGWVQRVELMSSLTGYREERVFLALEQHLEYLREAGRLESRRRSQQVNGFQKRVEEAVLKRYFEQDGNKELMESCQAAIKSGVLSARGAFKKILKESSF